VIPKKFERSNLVLELKTGKKQLKRVLHGLSDVQCGVAGAVGSDSISELVLRLIGNEFLALKEAYKQLSGSERKPFTGLERRTRFVKRRRHSDPKRSVESLLTEFEVVRSAIIRFVEEGAGNNAHYGTLAEICVARFNELIAQIERSRGLQLFGFNTRLRTEALEPELNAAILEIGKQHFLLENFDLQSLFSESLNRYYSDEIVLLLGTELADGKQAVFGRLAGVLEPVHMLLEMGLACVDVFRVVSRFQNSQGDFISEWEAVLGGTYSTRATFRWRTVRAWKQRVVIAERIEDCP
jgi:hypothetical protein